MSAAPPHPLLGAIVDAGRLQIVSVLGAGGFATVFLASEIESGKNFALKCLPACVEGTPAFALQVAELEAHLRVNDHPNVVTLHRVIEHDSYVIFVMDYCSGGDLQGPLEDTSTCQIMNNDTLLKRVFTQVLDAVAYCHSLGVYHRDLKPDNFLCAPDLSSVYLTDFGLATTEALSPHFRLGSKAYMSPECIREHIRLKTCPTAQSDVWSLGVMLYCLFTAHRPWSCAALSDEFYSRYERCPESLFEEYDAAPEVMDLIYSALHPNPYRRISVTAFRQRFACIETFYCYPKLLPTAPGLSVEYGEPWTDAPDVPRCVPMPPPAPIPVPLPFSASPALPTYIAFPTPSYLASADSNSGSIPSALYHLPTISPLAVPRAHIAQDVAELVLRDSPHSHPSSSVGSDPEPQTPPKAALRIPDPIKEIGKHGRRGSWNPGTTRTRGIAFRA